MKQNIRILAAEDNLVNQKVLRIILERYEYEFLIAQDGHEAVDLYQKSHFDMVLMDCQMPNLDGLSATQKIRDIENQVGKRRCPIIAMTANAMKGDKEKCLAVGMDDFLAKPFKSQELLDVIEKWKRGGQ